MLRAVYRLDARVERLARNALAGRLYRIDIGRKRVFEHIFAARRLHALDARQSALDYLLQGLLKLRIARKAELGRESDDSRLAHADRVAELRRSHERRLVVVFGYVVGYPLMSLGHGRVTALYF